MPGKDVIVVGTSTGGIDALQVILGGLPADFAGALFVVMHTAADSPGVLADILDQAGPLPARFPSDGERWEGDAFTSRRPTVTSCSSRERSG